MKNKHARQIVLLFVVPLLLFAVVRERNSWRPQVILKEIKAGGVGYVKFSPDGRYLSISTPYSTYTDEESWVYDMKTQKIIHDFKNTIFVQFPAVNRLAFIQGGQYCVCSLPDFKVLSTSLSAPPLSKSLAQEWEKRYTQQPFAVSSDGALKAISDNSASVITLQNARSGQILRTIDTQPTQALWMDFSPDGLWLAATHNDGTVKLWRLK